MSNASLYVLNRMLSAMMLGLALIAGTAIHAEDGNAAAICQLCGMDASASETEFVLKRPEEGDLHACCFNCARRLMKKTGVKQADLAARDYEEGGQIAAETAFYIIDSERIPKGSMPPFILAFAAEEKADAFSKKHGGSVISFKEVLMRLEKPATE